MINVQHKIITDSSVSNYLTRLYINNSETSQLNIKPGAPQGAALYDRRGRTLNSWGKYGQNIQA